MEDTDFIAAMRIGLPQLPSPAGLNIKTASVSRLRELLIYDHETGIFIWRPKVRGRACEGGIAGVLRPNGYRQIAVDKRLYMAHRIAWAMHYGCWPINQIDHKNGIRDDNRISNLREATRSEQMQNRILPGGTSPNAGVWWDASNKKWRASICVDHKRHSLGSFRDESDAANAYLAAKKRLHKFQQHPRVEHGK